MGLTNRYMQRSLAGIMWFILSLVVSAMNDALAKYLSIGMHALQIAFFRFLFSALVLLPFMCYRGKKSFYTSVLWVHCIRGVLLFFGISLWIYAVSLVPITTMTVISFSIPIFVLILAPFFLNEQVGRQLWGAAILGFVGIIIVLNPQKSDFNWLLLVVAVSVLMFAILDVLNKRLVNNEGILAMLFYSAIVTVILSIFPAIYFWSTPNLYDLSLLLLLGIGANLVLYCILKAFNVLNGSTLAPFRYIELLISVVIGYIWFDETPGLNTCLGAMLIILCASFVMHYQLKNNKAISQD